MRPEWWNTLAPDELPLMEAAQALVDAGEAQWDS